MMANMKEYYENRVAVAEFIAEATSGAVKLEMRHSSTVTADVSAKNMQFLADVVKSVENDVEYAKKQLHEYLAKEAAKEEPADGHHE